MSGEELESDLKRDESILAILIENSRGLYKSKYKRSGDLRADIAACRREIDDAFDFLNNPNLFD